MKNETSIFTKTNTDATNDGGKTNTRKAAERYIARGWQPVPIPKGQKSPILPKWEDVSFGLSHFSPTQNIGVVLDKSGLTEVDYDCEEAAFVGGKVLPTTLEGSRAGKLRKAFYGTALDKVYRDIGGFEDGKFKPGDKVMEVRCKGKQAVVYPSIHPSGERYEWLNGSEPQQVDAEELKHLCDKVAASALIARHLPDSGRHDLAMAYAGFMLRKGLSESDTLDILTVAWEYHNAANDAYDDLTHIVRDTAEKIRKDQPATGGNTLTSLIPGMTDALCDIFDWEQAPTPEEKAEQERQEKVRKAQEAWADPRVQSITKSPDILSEIYAALEADGLVGEETNAKLLMLSAVSTRHLGEPLSMLGEGTSSSGKSEVIKRVVKTLPPEFYIERQSVSDKALTYMGEELRRRILVVYELGGLGQQGSDGLEMAKQLLTEGKISRQIAESTAKGVRGRAVEVEGPTSLWTTTTKVFTDHELNTRLFKFQPDDSQDQTRMIIAGIFSEDRLPVDFGPFKALHTWLEAQDNRVTIPYRGGLAKKMVSSAVRLRRDAARLKYLISAHAVLHQATRERDPEGRIVATLDDYAAVHALVDNMIGVAAEKSVSPTVRETVEKAKELIGEDKPVNAKTLKDKLGCDRTTATRRLGATKGAGYLDHDPDQEGKAKVYVLGDPLPEAQAVLPTVGDLEREVCKCAPVSGGEGEGQVHEDSCALRSAHLGAHVHAHLRNFVPPREAKADTYQEFSVEEPTTGDVPGEVMIPAHTCTHDGSDPQNSDVCTHMCKEVCTGEDPTSVTTEDREEVWKWAVSQWEQTTLQDPTTTAARVIKYCNDAYEINPYTWRKRLREHGVERDIPTTIRAMNLADIAANPYEWAVMALEDMERTGFFELPCNLTEIYEEIETTYDLYAEHEAEEACDELKLPYVRDE